MPDADGRFLGEVVTPRRWDGSRLIGLTHGQLGEITTDQHHKRIHAHMMLYASPSGSPSEVYTSSLTYELLMSSGYFTPVAGTFWLLDFSHNVKNTGTLSSRGATFDVRFYRQGYGEMSIGEFRWTDGLADYKLMSLTVFTAIVYEVQSQFRIYWKIDDASYPCYSKNRFVNTYAISQTKSTILE